MTIQIGLERILSDEISKIKGARIGLICNPSAINQKIIHAFDLFYEHKDFELKAIFGPQHGARAEKQDNMIESKDQVDPYTGLPIYSLYSSTRKPTEQMVKDLDILVFDLQDVGSRYYTFIYTMALAMEACMEFNKKMVVLDRPNPIGGIAVQGNILQMHLKSFVGMFPIAVRHGMTVGELAQMIQKEFNVNCDLEVVPMKGWNREMYFDDTGLPWVIPSPNMPTLDTAIVYPGMCLLEGTQLSEGRGTTRPFEIFGAPYIDPWKLLPKMEAHKLKGVFFRPCNFEPTFNKYQGEVCGGFQIHVTDRKTFNPYLTALAILREVKALYPKKFAWKGPPYEYEYKKLPIDILSGDSRIREFIEQGKPLNDFPALWENELEAFKKKRKKYLLY